MKQVLLLVAALCAPLTLAGCDAAGPDAPPNVSTVSAAAVATQAARPSVSTDRPEPLAISPPEIDAKTPLEAFPAVAPQTPTASRGADVFTYTASFDEAAASSSSGTPTPAPGPPTTNAPRRPCEFGEDPAIDNCDTSGGNTWYPPPPGPVAYVLTDSDVRLEGHYNAEVFASSQTFDQNGRLTPIDYMSIDAYTTDGGVIIGSGSTGGANRHSTALYGAVPRFRSGQIRLCQNSSHHFVYTNSSGAHDETAQESDCEIWN